MSKKNTNSGGFTSIAGGKGAGASGGGGSNGDGPTLTSIEGGGKLLDMASVRAQRNQDNRRTVERFFLERMVDFVIEMGSNPQDQLPINVVEVSETGCSFRVSAEKAKTLPRNSKGEIDQLQVRIYFSSDSYLRVGFNVVNSSTDIAGGGQATRFGCQVDENYASVEAYQQFVRFMEMFAKHCGRDGKQASAF